MGSRSGITKKACERAYIAGFLDGDGSVMLQVKKRSDTPKGWRFMVTICFYQDSRHEQPLLWIRDCLGIGYLSRRNDAITEVRINGYEQCERILCALYPFIRFKKPQVDAILRVLKILNGTDSKKLKKQDRKKILRSILQVQNHNYQSKGKRTEEQLRQLLDLTP